MEKINFQNNVTKANAETMTQFQNNIESAIGEVQTSVSNVDNKFAQIGTIEKSEVSLNSGYSFDETFQNGIYYNSVTKLVVINFAIKGTFNQSQYNDFGTIPENLRPSKDIMVTASTGGTNDIALRIYADNGKISAYAFIQQAQIRGQVIYYIEVA